LKLPKAGAMETELSSRDFLSLQTPQEKHVRVNITKGYSPEEAGIIVPQAKGQH
jgi:hypothetical protein